MNILNTNHVLITQQNTLQSNNNIQRQKNNVYTASLDIKDDHEVKNIPDQKINENLVLLTQQSLYFIEFNRLLNSKRCVNIYVSIILVSLILFLYSILAYFNKYCTKLLN